jgi:NosR/NirI family transcriptional regulator, nitrous oxide reductase regulator
VRRRTQFAKKGFKDMFAFVGKYFNWLQKGAPTGEVVRYPVIHENHQSDVDGLFIVGDLSGLPLLKFAAKQGYEVIETIRLELQGGRASESPDHFEVAIIGAGAAGLAAALNAKRSGLNYVVLEAARTANTIVNFPKGKLIFAEPMQIANPSELPVRESNREELLDDWFALLEREKLNIREGAAVTDIQKKADGRFLISISERSPVTADRVVLATGKAGNARRLGVPGEELPKVFDRLFSPKDFHDADILVVGGGDTAVETAIALAETGNRVTLSYRRDSFSRLKSAHHERISAMSDAGGITVLFSSTVNRIDANHVELTARGNRVRVKNDAVFLMIGRELPYEFLRRIGVAIENAWTFTRFALYAAAVFIFTAVYFGKHVVASKVLQEGEPVRRFSEWGAPALIVSGMIIAVYLIYLRMNRNALDTMRAYLGPTAVLGVTLVASLGAVWWMSGQRDANFLWGKHPGFWYSLLYTVTIFVFGFRRMKRKNWDRYVTLQTICLALIQAVPLFLIPEFLAVSGPPKWVPQWIVEQAFPNGEYWRWYGFVLAYPLFIYNVLTGEPSLFWLIASVVQTFVIIPIIVYFFGKGAYCGWICSCGALAETLGDDYRTLAPHGERAKRWENLGQIILCVILALTVAWGLTHWTPAGSFLRTARPFGVALPEIVERVKHWYELLVDVGFAGTISLGVYFFYSGRIWCRFGCPLAAIMHIYAKFSRYRIFADKTKCISCNICTKECHMGIDVMGYASQGRPMDDVECVRCAACVTSCPMDVLSFGMTGTQHPHDPASRLHQLNRVAPTTTRQ